MYWNFRVVRHVEEGEAWFGIHEVFYDDDEKISLTVDPVPLCADTLEELRERIDQAFGKPVLDYDDY